MFLRYSSSVVAPITCSSPRASAGFSMFEASIEPSAAPAPTTVCSSSMKRISSSEAPRISSITVFSRSSNSPRYFVPAIIPARSSEITRRPASVSGTSSLTIRCAMPSTIAVLPTPGSPSRAGLFFVRRERISIVCSISSARPITGSSLPSRASWVRSRPNSSSRGVLDCSAERPRSTPRMTAPRSFVCERPNRCEQLARLRLLVTREREQHVLGADVGGTELARLLVGGEQRGLRVRGQRRGDVGPLAPSRPPPRAAPRSPRGRRRPARARGGRRRPGARRRAGGRSRGRGSPTPERSGRPAAAATWSRR